MATIPGRRAWRSPVRFDSDAGTGWLPPPLHQLLIFYDQRVHLLACLPIATQTHPTMLCHFRSTPFPRFSQLTIAAACPRIPLSICPLSSGGHHIDTIRRVIARGCRPCPWLTWYAIAGPHRRRAVRDAYEASVGKNRSLFYVIAAFTGSLIYLIVKRRHFLVF